VLGGHVFTFFKSLGYGIGSSLPTSRDCRPRRRSAGAKSSRARLICRRTSSFHRLQRRRRAADGPVTDIPDGWQGLDIGLPPSRGSPRARGAVDLWNGPMGVLEIGLRGGTRVAGSPARATGRRPGVVGGGDSVAALNQLGLASRVRASRPAAAPPRSSCGLLDRQAWRHFPGRARLTTSAPRY
jgi:phosphoglycerate kinase